MEKLLYTNEIINATLLFLRLCLNEMLDLFEYIPLLRELSTGLFILFVLYYYRWRRPHVPPHRAVRLEIGTLVTLILCAYFYYLTERREELYFVGGLHIFAVFVFVGCGVILPIYFLFVCRDGMKEIVLAMDVLLLLLERDVMLNRFLLLLFNWQYLFLISPFVHECRKMMVRTADPSVDIEEEKSHNKRVPKHLHQTICLLFQAATVYAQNQAFFTFTKVYGDRVNMDVHPFAGGVGMLRYDEYPIFSVVLMTFHKYAIFLLSMVFLYEMCQRPVTRDDHHNYRSSSATTTFHNLLQQWMGDHLAFCLILYFCYTNLGYYMISLAFNREVPFQEAVSTVGLLGAMGFMYCLLSLWGIFTRSRK